MEIKFEKSPSTPTEDFLRELNICNKATKHKNNSALADREGGGGSSELKKAKQQEQVNKATTSLSKILRKMERRAT